MDIIVLLQQAVLNHASDIFVVAGLPVSYRANGRICREKEEKLMRRRRKNALRNYISWQEDGTSGFLKKKEMMIFLLLFRDFRDSVSVRTNRGGALSAVIRVITFELPEPNEIGIPDPVMSFYNLSKGLVLVTGRREVEIYYACLSGG